jgi:hypothetical protein
MNRCLSWVTIARGRVRGRGHSLLLRDRHRRSWIGKLNIPHKECQIWNTRGLNGSDSQKREFGLQIMGDILYNNGIWIPDDIDFVLERGLVMWPKSESANHIIKDWSLKAFMPQACESRPFINEVWSLKALITLAVYVSIPRFVNLSPQFRMKWSCDGNLTKSNVCFCLQIFAIKCPVYSACKYGNASLYIGSRAERQVGHRWLFFNVGGNRDPRISTLFPSLELAHEERLPGIEPVTSEVLLLSTAPLTKFNDALVLYRMECK